MSYLTPVQRRLQEVQFSFMRVFGGKYSVYEIREWLERNGMTIEMAQAPVEAKTSFMEGQRVICGGKIGTILPPERGQKWNSDEYVWVQVPGQPGPCYYSTSNVKPLPNGQL